MAIQKVTISLGGHTGWHTHPGPILAIVTEGQIKHTRFTEKDGCIERMFGPGESEQAFVEVPNQVHMARNKGDVDAVLYMNQSQNSALSYGPDSGSALDNEFWDSFIARPNILVGGEIIDSSPKNPGC